MIEATLDRDPLSTSAFELVPGAVITSAGLVLAGTFSVLGVLPLVFLTEIGFTIAVGVLIDTFLVRSLPCQR